MDNIEKFKILTANMAALYEEKNKNYGNSFDKSLDEDGLLVSKIRLGDKYNRFSNLLKQKSKGTSDESIKDTLIDLANYAIMTIMWLENNNNTVLIGNGNPSTGTCQSRIVNKVGYI